MNCNAIDALRQWVELNRRRGFAMEWLRQEGIEGTKLGNWNNKRTICSIFLMAIYQKVTGLLKTQIITLLCSAFAVNCSPRFGAKVELPLPSWA